MKITTLVTKEVEETKHVCDICRSAECPISVSGSWVYYEETDWEEQHYCSQKCFIEGLIQGKMSSLAEQYGTRFSISIEENNTFTPFELIKSIEKLANREEES